VLQPLQAGQEAQQTDPVCRGTHRRAEVCVCVCVCSGYCISSIMTPFSPFLRTLTFWSHELTRKSHLNSNGSHLTCISYRTRKANKCVSVSLLAVLQRCSNTRLLSAPRYEDAVSKYETVMKTEPNVHHFSLLAKERMCHALAQVRAPTATAGWSNSVCDRRYIWPPPVCVLDRASRLAELCPSVEKSSSLIRRTSTCWRTGRRPISSMNSMRKVSRSDAAGCR